MGLLRTDNTEPSCDHGGTWLVEEFFLAESLGVIAWSKELTSLPTFTDKLDPTLGNEKGRLFPQ